MPSDKAFSPERREFFRISLKQPLKYKTCSTEDEVSRITPAESQNISQNGILFRAQEPPQISSILWMNLDIRTLNICKEIENRALVVNEGVLGKVVRVEEDTNDNRRFHVGVCFLTKAQAENRDVKKIMNGLKAS